MSRKYNIRWNENDLKEIKRLTKNFNAKVRRLEKKYAGNSDVILPEKVSYKDIVELVKTRGDLNRELKSLQSFTDRGSEKLVKLPKSDNNKKITNWQKKDMKKRAKRVTEGRIKRKAEVLGTPLKRNKKDLGYTRGELGMGTIDENMLEPTQPFYKNMDRYELKLKMDHLRKESQDTYWRQRDILLRDNFVNELEKNFNPELIKDVTEHIKNMDIDEFRKTFMEHPEDFSLGYPKSKKDEINFSNELRSNWLPNKKPE